MNDKDLRIAGSFFSIAITGGSITDSDAFLSRDFLTEKPEKGLELFAPGETDAEIAVACLFGPKGSRERRDLIPGRPEPEPGLLIDLGILVWLLTVAIQAQCIQCDTEIELSGSIV